MAEEGAKAILRAVMPSGNGDIADVKLGEIKALLVQLQDVFNEPEPEEGS